MKAISDVLEWFGGLGTTTEFLAQYAYRSARQAVIGEGTIHAQKITVALSLLGREFAEWKKWE